MFLNTEAKNAVAALEKTTEHFKAEVAEFEKVCLSRYDLCSDIKGEVYPELDNLLAAVSKAANQEASLDIGDRNRAICVQLKEKAEGIKNEIVKFDDLVCKVKAENAESTATQVGMAVGMISGLGGFAYAAVSGGSVGTLAVSSVAPLAVSTLMRVGLIGSPASWPLLGLLAGGSFLVGKFFQRSKNKETIYECTNARRELIKSTEEITLNRVKIKKDYNINAHLAYKTTKLLQRANKVVPRYGLTDEVLQEIQLIIEMCTQLTIYMNKKG